jgi:hypothetical protein
MTRKTNWRALEHLKHILEEGPNPNPRNFFASHPDDVNAYLHVRYIYARAVLRLGTRTGVSTALDSCLEIASMDRNNEQNGQTRATMSPPSSSALAATRNAMISSRKNASETWNKSMLARTALSASRLMPTSSVSRTPPC